MLVLTHAPHRVPTARALQPGLVPILRLRLSGKNASRDAVFLGEVPERESGIRPIPGSCCRSDLARHVLRIFCMGSSLAWGPGSFQMLRERMWNSATERTARPVRGAYRASPHRATFNDGVVVVCFLALVGLVVVGGLFMLLSWVTTTLPTNARIACPRGPACETSAPDETQLFLGDDGQTREPKPIP